jgi:nitrite reductase/ring-hydroxylating ferredoxin subunit
LSNQSTNEFLPVEGAKAPEEGELTSGFVGQLRVAIANVGGTYYAFDDTCTHMGCSISDGDLDDEVATCPCHMGQYDVRTGEVLAGPPPAPVKSYPVQVQDGVPRVKV